MHNYSDNDNTIVMIIFLLIIFMLILINNNAGSCDRAQPASNVTLIT
jgi:hypothetical protein